MPIITVKIAKGRSITTKRKLIKSITDIVVKTLEVKKEWVSVLIEEFDRSNWATAGELHCDKFGTGFGKKKSK
jgi:4-oxalocrotonate tautomerase